MTTLLLIRHGDNEFLTARRLAGLLPDVHLNSHGYKQAQHLADRYAGLPIKAIFTSPLERAMETALPLSRVKHLDIQIMRALIEIDPGDWTGQTVDELRTRGEWKFAQNIPADFCFPHGDSYRKRQKEMIAAIDRLIRGYSANDFVACFSHADPIKLCLAHYLGMNFNRMQRLVIPPASVSFIRFDGDAIYTGPIAQVDEISTSTA